MDKFIEQTFNYLHSHPEKSFCEYETSAYIATSLNAMGYKVNKVGNTSLIAVVDGKSDGPVLAIRCDMDALEFARDGKPVYIHACGHDAHATMVLAAAGSLAMQKPERGKLMFIFQAAEETGAGAKELIEAGAVDGVEEMIGIHLRPKVDTILGEATCAVLHSSCMRLILRINGKASHAARPHLGINAIEAGVMIVNGLSSIHLDPAKSYSVKATEFKNVGNSPNTIPYEVQLTVDVRCEDNEGMKVLKSRLSSLIGSVENYYGININILADTVMPAPEYDPKLMSSAERAIVRVLGKCNPPCPTTGSEDFHNFSVIKGIKTAYIGLGADLEPGLHDMNMHFDTRCLEQGRDILLNIIKEKLYE